MKVIATIDLGTRKILELTVLEAGETVKESDGEGRALRILELAGDEQLALLRSGAWGADPATRQLVELPFRVMVLDDQDVYIDKIELGSSAELLANHVDLRTHGLGGDCDLPFGLYRWDREASTLVALGKTGQRPAPSGVSLERALMDFWEQIGVGKLPKSTRAWVEQYRNSHDVKKKGR